MRILQVGAFPFPSPQGSQVYVRGIARSLARRGHDVRLLCYAHGQGEEDQEYEILRTPDLFGYRNMRAGPDWVKPILDAFLMRKLMQIDVDIIHVHNYEAPIAALLTRWKHKTPIVYSAHNMMQEELPVYFSQPVSRRAARYFGGLLDRHIPKRLDHSIAIREQTVERLHNLGCRQVSCVPPGVALDDIQECHPAVLPSAGPWVVYAGNLDAYQDLPVLFKAMQQVPQVGLLLISANDFRHWLPQIHDLPRVHYRQTDDFQVVRSYLSAADIAALPRSVCSGFPIKLLNYLGMGLPTVAAAGGIQEFPGVVRFRNGDDRALAHIIRGLAVDSMARETLGQQGKKHIMQNWTWEIRAKQLENIYKQMLLRHFPTR